MAMLCSATLAAIQLPAHAQEKERPMKYPALYRTIRIDGLSLFYKEAGPKDAVMECGRFHIVRTTRKCAWPLIMRA